MIPLSLNYLGEAGVWVFSAKNSDFLALNSAFPYLLLVKAELPFQVQTFFNQKINSTIPGNDLVWNMSLLYKFSNSFSAKK
jgi:hypothetical protein